MPSVLCLRPQADFTRVGVVPPQSLDIDYLAPDDPQMPALLKQADALVIPAVGPKLPLDLFEDARLQLVQVTGAGVDRVDAEGLRALGIALANVPGGSNEAIAEYAVACAAALLRRVTEASAEIRNGQYSDFRSRFIADNVDGIEGLLVGIVGLGIIGTAVARKFKLLGCNIAFYDPAPADPQAAIALEAEALGLEELFSRCDVVTVHVSLLPATTDLIDADVLSKAKKGSVLIQASRGGVVNEKALADALEAGHMAGAAVDVYS
ncbi:MAG: 2-hydroxyacid dehydrogenase, partial [Hyphomicrobiales bacterium]|nr:2-hydroxyacid dehydrogenase [Hyphomicrobiales bacterium]